MPAISLDSLSVLTNCQKQNLATAGVTTVEEILSRELPVKGIKLPDVKHKVRQVCNIPLAVYAHTWCGLRCHALVTIPPRKTPSSTTPETASPADQGQQHSRSLKAGEPLPQQHLARGTIGAILVYPKTIRVQFKFLGGGEVERSGIYLLSLNRLWATSEILSDVEDGDELSRGPTSDADACGTELPRLIFTDSSECKDFCTEDLSRLREYQWECNSLFEISRKLATE